MRPLLFAAAILSASAARSDEPAAKPTGDRASLVGTWEIKSFTDDRPDDTRGMGRLGVVPAKPGQPRLFPKLVCTGDEMFVIRAGGKRETAAGLSNCAWAKFAVDEKATPKAIDLWKYQAAPGGKEHVYKGVYELDGKTLKICWAETSPDRPKKVGTTAHDNVLVCEKISDTPESPAGVEPAGK